MILDHNTTAKISYNYGNINTVMKEIKGSLTNDTKTWNSSLNARLITADEIAKITNNKSFNSLSSTSNDWFYFDNNSQNQIAKAQGTRNIHGFMITQMVVQAMGVI